jgi:oxazoline/thiazoline dehydrogenase
MSVPATATTEPEFAVRAGTALLPAADSAPDLDVTDRRGVRRISVGSPAALAAVLSLGQRPATAAALTGEVLAAPGSGMSDAVALQAVLRRLTAAGALDSVVRDGDRPVARLTGEGVLPVVRSRAPAGSLVLHRHAVLTVADGVVAVESGRSHARVLLDPELVPALAGPVERGDVAPWCHVVDLLASAQLLRPAGAAEPLAERQWSAADLWFHRRSRESRGTDRYGGTYPFLGVDAPPPARPEPRDAVRVPLPVPDLAARRRDDPPLTAVLEDRRSVRAFDPAVAPTLDQLGELLYRTARIRREFVTEHGLEVVDRPFPAGGSVHELELYAVVTRCTGLDPGLWRYDGHAHALEQAAADGPAVRRLAGDCRATARLDDDPPIALAVSARFGRLMWKYEAIPYALILKHVGVLYQTLYLTATAMGLGVCALGGGSTAAFAAATGLPPLVEGLVGELVVGVPADETGSAS